MPVAQRHYSEVRLYVFSDHAWQIVTIARSESENRRVARPHAEDYIVVYDSTMARSVFNDRGAASKSLMLGQNSARSDIRIQTATDANFLS